MESDASVDNIPHSYRHSRHFGVAGMPKRTLSVLDTLVLVKVSNHLGVGVLFKQAEYHHEH